MSLSAIDIPIRFGGGIDTAPDPKLVTTAKLLDLRDGRFIRPGVIGKRNGYDALARLVDGAVAHGPPVALAVRDGLELVMWDREGAYSYRAAADRWSPIGGGGAAVTSTEAVLAATGTDQEAADAAEAGGVVVVAWEDSRGGVWWTAADAATGRSLRAPAQLAGPGNAMPRVVAVSDRVVILWQNLAGGMIYAATVNPAAYLDEPAVVVVTADASVTSLGFDAVRHDDSVGDFPAVLAFGARDHTVRVGYLDSSGALGGSGLPADVRLPVSSDGPVSVSWYGDRVAVAWVDGGDVNVRTQHAGDLSDDLAELVIGAPSTPARLAIVADDHGTVWAWVECVGGGTATTPVVVYGHMSSSGAVGDTRELRGHCLVSRAFVEGEAAYVAVGHAATFFPYMALVRHDGVVVGRALVGTFDNLPTRPQVASAQRSGSTWAVTAIGSELLTEASAADPAAFTETSARSCRFNFADPHAYMTAPWGGGLVMAGSCPLYYDGDSIAELGFHTAPDDGLTLTPGVGGELTDSSSYLYGCCYEWTDARGVRHRGAMSVERLVPLATGENRVTVQIPTCRLTGKRRVSIGVYRSRSNGDATAMYRVSSLNPSATGSNGYVVNDATVDFVTFVDDLDDLSMVASGERAYTTAGALSNDPIGLGAVVTEGNGRLFFTAPDDPLAVRFSKEWASGVGPELAGDLQVSLPAAIGSVTALAVDDNGNVIAFGPTSIYAFGGDGPLDNPDASPRSFGRPRRITGAVGCSSPRSIASTPVGLAFIGSDGVPWLLDPSGAVHRIGTPVQAFAATRYVRACAVPGQTAVLFLPSSRGDRALLYDWTAGGAGGGGEWSTYTNHEGTDAVAVGRDLYYSRLDHDGRVFRASTSYTDAGRAITLYLETAWVTFGAARQGLQKVWYAQVLGQYLSPHTLRMRFAVDYQAGWLEPVDIDADAEHSEAPWGGGAFGAGPFGGASDSAYRHRVHLGLESHQAIRFQIEDVASTPTLGASFTLTELLLTGGVLPSAKKYAATRTS